MNKLIFNRLTLLGFLGLSTFSLSSVSVAENLPVMVVTPSRIAIAVENSSVPVEVITRQQIENSMSQDVADIIKFHAGLEIARNGDYGKVTSLFVRGTDSNHTVILVDGVKINPATIGSAAIQNISPSIIDHIEIVKGPRSSVYGSEAIGGVVNIITKKEFSAAQGNVTVGAGGNSTKSANIDLSSGKDNFSAGIVFNTFSTDGFSVTDASTQDHGYENDTINAFLNYTTDRHQLNLSQWQTTGNVEYYSFGELNQDYTNSASILSWNAEISDSLSSSFRGSQIQDEVEQQVENYLSQLDYAETNRDELDFKLDFHINSEATFSAGVLSAVEQVDALSFGTVIVEDNDINEIYAVYQAIQGDHDYAISFRYTDHEGFGNHDTWNMNYQYHVETGTRLYAGLGSAFRAPDNTDRFGYGGNPELLSEMSENIELGLIFDLRENSQLKLSIFKTSIDDLIVLTGTWPNYKMDNVEEAEITGFEISFDRQVNQWQYHVNALLQDPVNKTLDEALSRRAQSRVNLQVTYQQALWQLSAYASVVSARDDSSFSDVTLPPYELVDLSAFYHLSRNTRLSAKIDNLFNESYETASGFNSKDRTLMLELKYSFLD